MKFPNVNLTDLDKSQVLLLLTAAKDRLPTMGDLAYICRAMEKEAYKDAARTGYTRLQLINVADELQARIEAAIYMPDIEKMVDETNFSLEEANDYASVALAYWVMQEVPEAGVKENRGFWWAGKEMLAYRIAWIKHMLEQVQ